MSQNGNDNDIISKQDVINQKLGKTRYIDLEFAHKSVDGESFINFASLNTPSEYTALDGFTNPSPASLMDAQIRLNKANVELRSTGVRGSLQNREDYIIQSNGGIKLLYVTSENEIISGTIRSVVRNQPSLIDASKIVKTGVLAEGANTFVVGNSFKLFDNPSEQVGAILVYRFQDEETPKLMFRNDGNISNGVGNYHEVDGGNNLSNTIEFNEVGRVGGENILVVSYALQVGRPQTSYLQELETLGGQVDIISDFLEEIHDLDSNVFQTAPNQIDLKSFGDKVVNLEKILEVEISQVSSQSELRIGGSTGGPSTVTNGNLVVDRGTALFSYSAGVYTVLKNNTVCTMSMWGVITAADSRAACYMNIDGVNYLVGQDSFDSAAGYTCSSSGSQILNAGDTLFFNAEGVGVITGITTTLTATANTVKKIKDLI